MLFDISSIAPRGNHLSTNRTRASFPVPNATLHLTLNPVGAVADHPARGGERFRAGLVPAGENAVPRLRSADRSVPNARAIGRAVLVASWLRLCLPTPAWRFAERARCGR